ncbi:hypothetical protein A2V56_05340 [Candidatus Woesebacteria bacterium RBG_19FT_COMBO_42_9]|uniref:Uncharacterized protein n=1 Tax=Candidatus Woesebacteria bacterium RBG_16_42_24 TaxID=1802485 RepID=A0A1F7XLW3_9BACT|nr:MAG: hypothetical protein A2V97_03805 [Candidatus Woesebacteria bacterium RBG_16_42_24]OGM17302.1 MAG: hypothetical protein A2V56_05340 [Candidatus Woesebacteria bacterium RBG_19FT_COMBO_42_9]
MLAMTRIRPTDTPMTVGKEIPASGRVSADVGVAVGFFVGVRVADIEAVGETLTLGVGVGLPVNLMVGVGVTVGVRVAVAVGAWASESSSGATGETFPSLDRKILVAVKTAIPASMIVAAAIPIIGSLFFKFSFIV